MQNTILSPVFMPLHPFLSFFLAFEALGDSSHLTVDDFYNKRVQRSKNGMFALRNWIL